MNSPLFILIAHALCDQGASVVLETSSRLPAGETKTQKTVTVDDVTIAPLSEGHRLAHCNEQKLVFGYDREFTDCVFWTGGNVAADVAAYYGGWTEDATKSEGFYDAMLSKQRNEDMYVFYADGETEQTKFDLAQAINTLNGELLEGGKNVEQIMAIRESINNKNRAAADTYSGKIGFPGWKHQLPGEPKPRQDWPQLSQNFACMCRGRVDVYFALPFAYAKQSTRRIELGQFQLEENRAKVFMQTELPTLLENGQMTEFGVFGIYGFCQLVGPFDERQNAIQAMGPHYWKQVAMLSRASARLLYGTLDGSDRNSQFVKEDGGSLPREDVKSEVDMAYRQYLQLYRTQCKGPGFRGEACRESYATLTPFATYNINRMTDPQGAAWTDAFLRIPGGSSGQTTDDIVEGYGYVGEVINQRKAHISGEVTIAGLKEGLVNGKLPAPERDAKEVFAERAGKTLFGDDIAKDVKGFGILHDKGSRRKSTNIGKSNPEALSGLGEAIQRQIERQG